MSPPKFEIFLIFPYFLRFLVLSRLATWRELVQKFAILDITFRFTCGQSDLYENIVKLQNIMTKIVDKVWFYLKLDFA